ncbi:MAG: EamA family transporter, partial [Pseudomonadota bacterium]
IVLIARATKLSTVKPELQLLYQLSVSAILLLPIALLVGDTFRNPVPMHWLIFVSQVVLVVCVGFLVWFWVLSVYPASDMASYSFLAPLFGVLFGWLILSEPITITIVIALVLVTGGIVLVNRH